MPESDASAELEVIFELKEISDDAIRWLQESVLASPKIDPDNKAKAEATIEVIRTQQKIIAASFESNLSWRDTYEEVMKKLNQIV